MPHQVAALALPGVVAFDLATVTQVFGHPAEPEYSCAVVSDGGEPVMTTSGFAIAGVAGLAAIKNADTVIVPGYRPHGAPSQQVLEALRQAHEDGTRVASVCTGAFALAAAGLLDGLRATTHWQDAAELQRLHPRIEVQPDVLYIDHGAVATSAGVAAGIDLCLHLVRRDHGAHLANSIARRMVVAPHRSGGQAQFATGPSRSAPESGLAEVSAWVRDHLEETLSVGDLARQAGLSERQVARRFVAETGLSPLQWVLHQRVLAAMELLESTDLPVDSVARRTGLGTATTLRRHFRRQLGTSPRDYRRAFTVNR